MSIIVSDKMYVGYNLRGGKDNKIVLGFATYLPLDDTKKQQTAYEKRKSTVDTWSKRGWHQTGDNPETGIVDNELLEGFKIAREVRRCGWGSGNVLWRIEDPRGFELEISSANMASILSCTTMREGVIEGKCKWGWNLVGGSRVVLLPEVSEPYQEAIKTTTLKQRKETPIKQVNIGDKVTLKNETVGIYCGSLHYVQYDWLIDRPEQAGTVGSGYYWKPSKRRTHFFVRNDGVIYTMASPKVAEVQPVAQPLTTEQGAELINTHLQNGASVDTASGYSQYVCVSDKPIKVNQISLELVPTDIDFGTVKRHSDRRTFLVKEPAKAGGHLSRFESYYDANTHRGGNHDEQYTRMQRLDEHALTYEFVYRKLRKDDPRGTPSYSNHTWKVDDTGELTKSQIDQHCDKFELVVVLNDQRFPSRIW